MPRRWIGIGLAALAAGAAAIAGIAAAGSSANGGGKARAVPSSTPSPARSSQPAASPRSRLGEVPLGRTGFDIRYLDEDGREKALRVNDFPR